VSLLKRDENSFAAINRGARSNKSSADELFSAPNKGIFLWFEPSEAKAQ